MKYLAQFHSYIFNFIDGKVTNELSKFFICLQIIHNLRVLYTNNLRLAAEITFGPECEIQWAMCNLRSGCCPLLLDELLP